MAAVSTSRSSAVTANVQFENRPRQKRQHPFDCGVVRFGVDYFGVVLDWFVDGVPLIYDGTIYHLLLDNGIYRCIPTVKPL